MRDAEVTLKDLKVQLIETEDVNLIAGRLANKANSQLAKISKLNKIMRDSHLDYILGVQH